MIAGQSRGIRADEFLRTSPWRMGLTESGNDAFGSPLGSADVSLIANDGDFSWSTVLFFESSLLTKLGAIAPLFAYAAAWWLPVALCVALLPVWLLRLRVPFSIGLPSVLLVVFAPAAVWWTWGPSPALGWALVAALAAMLARERYLRPGPRWPVAAFALLSAFGLARTALTYTPWLLPIAGFVLLPTFLVMVRPGRGRPRTLLLLGAIAAVAILILGLFAIENYDALRNIAQTEYPGSRRSGGHPVSWALLFGAPFLWVIQSGTTTLVGTNQSELAGSYLILGIPIFALIPAIRWQARSLRSVTVLGNTILLVGWLAWVTLTLPDASQNVFPLSLSPPERVGQVLGMGAAITFAMVLAAFRVRRHESPRGAIAVTAGVAATWFLLMAGGALKGTYLTGLPTWAVWLTSLAWGVAIGIALWWRSPWWSMLPLSLLAAVVVVVVNPIQVGFGDLQTSPAAEAVRTAQRTLDPGDRWAADDPRVDALLMANGVPAASGQQWIGPDNDAWEILDPGQTHRAVWNRGASYIQFQWAPKAAATQFENPSPDSIVVRIDPCSARLRELGIRQITSAQRLVEYTCLTQESAFSWAGGNYWIYRVADPGAPTAGR